MPVRSDITMLLKDLFKIISISQEIEIYQNDIRVFVGYKTYFKKLKCFLNLNVTKILSVQLSYDSLIRIFIEKEI